jgi:cytosine/uracil/thiamine/allantoin permease
MTEIRSYNIDTKTTTTTTNNNNIQTQALIAFVCFPLHNYAVSVHQSTHVRHPLLFPNINRQLMALSTL